MERKESNKTNIFRIEIFERKPLNNRIDKSKSIKNAPLFKIKKTNENNKNEIIFINNIKKNEQVNAFPIKPNDESIIGMEERNQGNFDDTHWKKEKIRNHNENSGVFNNNNLIEIMEEEPKIEDELNIKGSTIGDRIILPEVDTKKQTLDIHGSKFGTNTKGPSLDISEFKINTDIKGSALAINCTKIVDGINKKVQKIPGIDGDIKEQKIYGIDINIKGSKLHDFVADINQQKLIENDVNTKRQKLCEINDGINRNRLPGNDIGINRPILNICEGPKLSEINDGINRNRLPGNDIGINRPMLNIYEGQIDNRYRINHPIDIKKSSCEGSNIFSPPSKKLVDSCKINYLFYPQNKDNNLEKGKGKF